MATDFTAVNAAVQTLIDAATKPLNDTIAGLKAQVATLTQQIAEDDEMFYWFKGSSNQVYVYNPIAGTKRPISAAEWAVIKAVTPSATFVTLTDAQVTAIKSA